ncbi:MAG: PP2C family protein-serine/threonine phosphatase [Aeromicrobium sp.]
MTRSLRRLPPAVVQYIDHRVDGWRTGSSEGQRTVLFFLYGLSVLILMGSLIDYRTVAAAWFVVPMLFGTVTLRHRQLLMLMGWITMCVAITVTVESVNNGMTGARLSTLGAMLFVVVVLLYDSSHRRSGVPHTVSEAMLLDLRDRLQSQGTVPPLPAGWTAQSAMKFSGGARFSGDFLVATLTDDDTRLEMVLVDVCGKGVAAGTRSLQFAGALGGLIGALPPNGLFAAANSFLLRQQWDDGFATAVHVLVDLRSGDYTIICAGHPPALRWDAQSLTWEVDGARGQALGIAERPEFQQTTGTLAHGDALMFYTDGVVESRSRDFTTGIEWLRARAGEIVVADGFAEAPARIIAEVDPGDDRAILMLTRLDPSVIAAAGTASASRRPTRDHP